MFGNYFKGTFKYCYLLFLIKTLYFVHTSSVINYHVNPKQIYDFKVLTRIMTQFYGLQINILTYQNIKIFFQQMIINKMTVISW